MPCDTYGGAEASLIPGPARTSPRPWRPVDVAAHGDVGYVLDQRYGRVYAHPRGAERLRLVLASPGAAGVWTRLAVDRDGRLYLFNLSTRQLDVYDRQGTSLGPIADADDVRDRFDPPAVSVDQWAACTCRRYCRAPGGHGGLLVDREGLPSRVRESDPPPQPAYLTSGNWISNALDSGIEDCQWHRIELALGSCRRGPGSGTDHAERSSPVRQRVAGLPDELWDTHYAETGAMQPPNPGAPFDGHRELLVQSHSARYLWLRIVLEGDGFASPALDAVRIHYPRESGLQLSCPRSTPPMTTTGGSSSASSRSSKPNGMNCSKRSPPAHASSIRLQCRGAACLPGRLAGRAARRNLVDRAEPASGRGGSAQRPPPRH